jgi:hypothetical protein
LNGAEKTHGIFNRRQREQADGSRCLDRFRIASILALLVHMELVAAKDRTLSVRPFIVCILRMPFSFGLMRVESAGLEYPPFWQHEFRIR